jgi:hypothetical protein
MRPTSTFRTRRRGRSVRLRPLFQMRVLNNQPLCNNRLRSNYCHSQSQRSNCWKRDVRLHLANKSHSEGSSEPGDTLRCVSLKTTYVWQKRKLLTHLILSSLYLFLPHMPLPPILVRRNARISAATRHGALSIARSAAHRRHWYAFESIRCGRANHMISDTNQMSEYFQLFTNFAWALCSIFRDAGTIISCRPIIAEYHKSSSIFSPTHTKPFTRSISAIYF